MRRPRAQTTVGAAITPYGMLASVARPIADCLAALGARWDSRGGDPIEAPGALWEASGGGEAHGGLPSVPSISVALRDLLIER